MWREVWWWWETSETYKVPVLSRYSCQRRIAWFYKWLSLISVTQLHPWPTGSSACRNATSPLNPSSVFQKKFNLKWNLAKISNHLHVQKQTQQVPSYVWTLHHVKNPFICRIRLLWLDRPRYSRSSAVNIYMFQNTQMLKEPLLRLYKV